MAPAPKPLVAGILVGGASTRMGRDKALLLDSAGATLAERQLRLARRVGAEAFLLGATDPALRSLAPSLADAVPCAEFSTPQRRGPLAGLVALLEARPMARALLLACDMPYLTESLLRRLLTQEPGAAVAFRRAERWEPLCALYDAPLVAGVARRRFDAGSHSMQGLLEAVGARRLELAPEELALLDDWDAPEDLARG